MSIKVQAGAPISFGRSGCTLLDSADGPVSPPDKTVDFQKQLPAKQLPGAAPEIHL